jgi:hypothetical protein
MILLTYLDTQRVSEFFLLVLRFIDLWRGGLVEKEGKEESRGESGLG